MPKVVRVWIGKPNKGGYFNGTAFFIDKNTLVTAKHVVRDRENKIYENIFLGNTPDGGIIPIDEIILCDRDLAILKIKKSFEIKNEFLDKDIIEKKDVVIIGYQDDDSSMKSYENRISGYSSSEHTYELQSHLTNGLSGSPVLLDGKICGIANAINRNKNLTYTIPISELCVDIKEEKKQNIVEEIANDEKVSKEVRESSKKFLEYWYTIKNYPKISLIVIMIGSLWYFKDSIVKNLFDSNNFEKKRNLEGSSMNADKEIDSTITVKKSKGVAIVQKGGVVNQTNITNNYPKNPKKVKTFRIKIKEHSNDAYISNNISFYTDEECKEKLSEYVDKNPENLEEHLLDIDSTKDFFTFYMKHDNYGCIKLLFKTNKLKYTFVCYKDCSLSKNNKSIDCMDIEKIGKCIILRKNNE